jgi:hypothetical protein
MKYLPAVLVLLLAACGKVDNGPPYRPLTYEELVQYQPSCSKQVEQLRELRRLQNYWGFKADPDELNDDDREYNSRLKNLIWWYPYNCQEQE